MVKISAMECILTGAQMVTDLRLTEAIQFSVETQFTWQTDPPAITSNSDIKVGGDCQHARPFQMPEL